ncbi:MAG: protein-disulfide reductase DsbD domain-containing protein, partial [Chromatiaceae bacterium]
MHATIRPRLSPAPGRGFLAYLLTLVLGVLAIGANASAEDEFLLPEQAFVVSGEADGPDAVRVRWQIADGYYMYRSKFRFTSKTEGIEAGKPELPQGETKHDEFFGDVEIFRGDLEVRVPLERAAGSEHVLSLETTSQGCADAGLCYPPHRQSLTLELPALAAALQTASATPPVGERILGEQTLDGLVEPAQPSFGLMDEEEILTAEQAFRFQAEATAPDRLQLTWDIAPETYLYADKVEVFLEGAAETALGPFQLPPGEIKKDSILPDGSIGDVEVFHDRIDLTLPLMRGSTAPTEVTLVAKYQGCAERGICYPPQTQKLKLSLPEALA